MSKLMTFDDPIYHQSAVRINNLVIGRKIYMCAVNSIYSI